MFQVQLDTTKVDFKRLSLIFGFTTIDRVLRTAIHAKLIPAIRENIRNNASVDTGQLHRSISTKMGIPRTYKTTYVSIDVGTFGVQYGLNVEKGSPPHFPKGAQYGKLRGWVHRKIKPSALYTTDEDGKRTKVYSKAQREAQITWLIARSIAKKGIAPRPYMMHAFLSQQWALSREIVRRFQKLV